MEEIPPYNEKDGLGFGWNEVRVDFEVKHPDTIIYGVTSDSTFTGKPCESLWFSVDGMWTIGFGRGTMIGEYDKSGSLN